MFESMNCLQFTFVFLGSILGGMWAVVSIITYLCTLCTQCNHFKLSFIENIIEVNKKLPTIKDSNQTDPFISRRDETVSSDLFQYQLAKVGAIITPIIIIGLIIVLFNIIIPSLISNIISLLMIVGVILILLLARFSSLILSIFGRWGDKVLKLNKAIKNIEQDIMEKE